MSTRCTACNAITDGKEIAKFSITENSVKYSVYVCGDCVRSSTLAVAPSVKLSSDEREMMDEFKNLIAKDDDFRKEFLTVVKAKVSAINPVKKDLKKMTPRQIAEVLGQYVIGQQQAREELAIVLHRKALRETNSNIGKLNILLAGPTATGKTELGRASAELFDVPFVTVDVNSLSPASYKGANVTSIFESLMAKANNDREKAERGIVLLDEFDKLIRKDNDSKVKDELLAIIEGGTFTVDQHTKGSYQFSTHNITFIATGAFSGLLANGEVKVATRKAVSMTESNKVVPLEKKEAPVTEITPEKLVEWGCKEELVGRFQVLATLKKLTNEDLYKILTEKKNNLVAEYTSIFATAGNKFEPSKEYLMSVCERANKEITGARTLKKIMEKDLRPYIMDGKDFIGGVDSEETVTLELVA